MNCPSRPDKTDHQPDWNQSPQALNADATTRADLNGISNLREQRHHVQDNEKAGAEVEATGDGSIPMDAPPPSRAKYRGHYASLPSVSSAGARLLDKVSRIAKKLRHIAFRYSQFIGPGMVCAVAYVDPGNFSTSTIAGASTKYSLLSIILLSNLIAIFLQSLCIKLGTVTGLDLAQNCRQRLPKWLTIILYLFAEIAIITTDMAEVIGSAIALNLLFHVPLVGGCAITIVDVFITLLFFKPEGSMTHVRIFEYFVMVLVFGVAICFGIQLSFIRNASVGEVFRGYLPSSAIVDGNGIYLSCGIIGATVMPHSLFLGSSLCFSRLMEFDRNERARRAHSHTINITITTTTSSSPADQPQTPLVSSIKTCTRYSTVELATSLFTFALFVNSAILILAGSSLSNDPSASSGDLFAVHDLLSHTLTPAAGTIFALALLMSGLSAGIVCTMAGQIVSDGFLNWKLKPWKRRLITRAISVTPSIIIAAAVGKDGLDQALVASQVALSVILPVVSAPLVWFTARGSVMTVTSEGEEADARADGRMTERGEEREGHGAVNLRNSWPVSVLALLVWLVLVVMNVALLVLLGLGKA